MKKDLIIVFTTIIDDPTRKTVGTKYVLWNGSIGSITDPAASERPILIVGFIINNTIMPKRSSIGIIIDAMASA